MGGLGFGGGRSMGWQAAAREPATAGRPPFFPSGAHPERRRTADALRRYPSSCPPAWLGSDLTPRLSRWPAPAGAPSADLRTGSRPHAPDATDPDPANSTTRATRSDARSSPAPLAPSTTSGATSAPSPSPPPPPWPSPRGTAPPARTSTHAPRAGTHWHRNRSTTS